MVLALALTLVVAQSSTSMSSARLLPDESTPALHSVAAPLAVGGIVAGGHLLLMLPLSFLFFGNAMPWLAFAFFGGAVAGVVMVVAAIVAIVFAIQNAQRRRPSNSAEILTPAEGLTPQPALSGLVLRF